MGQTPIIVAVYTTLAATLSGQWIAAKIGVTAERPFPLQLVDAAVIVIGVRLGARRSAVALTAGEVLAARDPSRQRS